jgi:hypothetical protein
VKAIRLGLLVSIVSTLLAGLYFIVYIYRWEMHRALIAGVVFLAGEIALATTLVLRRIETLRPLEPVVSNPLPQAEETLGAEARTADAVHSPDPPPKPGSPFPWLGADRFGVFVPILLGAGIIVSGVGWVVEHLARATSSGSGAGGRFERSLAAIAMPVAPLVGPAPIARRSPPPNEPPKLSMLGRVVVVLLIGSLVAVLLTLALLGRTRPDPPVAGTRSTLNLEVMTRNDLGVDVAARSLVEACHVWIPEHEVLELRATRAGHYVLVLEPALSDQASRRFLGCMNDGTLERVHAELGEHTRLDTAG